MFQISETKVKVQDMGVEEAEELNTDSIWKTMQSNVDKILPFVNDSIDRWNARNINT